MIKKIRNKLIILNIIFIIMLSPSNIFASENARIFTTSLIQNQVGPQILFAENGFKKLNYNCSFQKNTTLGALLAWTNQNGEEYSNENYAFYINATGPTNEEAAIGGPYFIGENGEHINPGVISGNWHLVFIDSPNSASTDAWPDSLNITGRSNRAFLGWTSYVEEYYSISFNISFWGTYVGNFSIEEAMTKAAASVPGEGSTPIGFVGDGTWYGYAN